MMNDNPLISPRAMDNFINELQARKSFYEFVDAINSESKMASEIKKTLSLIDDIIVNDESTGFKKCLESGTTCYRARIIDSADDGDSNKMLHNTKDKKLKGYNEFNSREPLLGIPGAGRNNIEGGILFIYCF